MQELAALLQETGRAHHAAFLETDGADPDWPLWYAGYLEDRLPGVIGQDLTRSEIVYHLVAASRAFEADESDEPWPEYYARFLGGA